MHNLCGNKILRLYYCVEVLFAFIRKMSAVEKVVRNFLNIEFDVTFLQLMQMIHKKAINALEVGYNLALKTYLERSLFKIFDSQEMERLLTEILKNNLWIGSESDQIISIFLVIEIFDEHARKNLTEHQYIHFAKELSKLCVTFLSQRYPKLNQKFLAHNTVRMV